MGPCTSKSPLCQIDSDYYVQSKSVADEGTRNTMVVIPISSVIRVGTNMYSVMKCQRTGILLFFDNLWHVSPDRRFCYKVFPAAFSYFPNSICDLLLEYFVEPNPTVGEYFGVEGGYLEMDQPIFGASLTHRIARVAIDWCLERMTCKELDSKTGVLRALKSADSSKAVLSTSNLYIRRERGTYPYRYLECKMHMHFIRTAGTIFMLVFGHKSDDEWIIVQYDSSMWKASCFNPTTCVLTIELSEDLRTIGVKV